MSTRLFHRARTRWLFLALLCACTGAPLHLSMQSARSSSGGRSGLHRGDTGILPVRALPLASPGVQIIGRLALAPSGEIGATDVELPDVAVSLQSASSGATLDTMKTELNGKFRLRAASTGSYR